MAELQERPFKPSTIGTIDEAVFKHIDEAFNLFVRTASGREKVPVIWQTAERTFQIKNNSENYPQSVSNTTDTFDNDEK